MPVREISEAKFDALKPYRAYGKDPGSRTEEKAWFSNHEGSVIGIVAFDRPERECVPIVQQRDAAGKFGEFSGDIEVGLATKAAARERVEAWIEELSS